MKIDPEQSVYQESESAQRNFSRAELKHLRYLLRRLRFLEAQSRESDPSTSAALHATLEIEALEWTLKDLGYLPKNNRVIAVSGN